jgi:chaperonin GroES
MFFLGHNGHVRPLTLLINQKWEVAMRVRPLYDRILVQRMQEEEKTKGGIIIPETAKEKSVEGKVVAAGKGKLNEKGELAPLEVKPGDRVMFGKYAGTEIQIEGEDYLIMREDDLLAIIEE